MDDRKRGIDGGGGEMGRRERKRHRGNDNNMVIRADLVAALSEVMLMTILINLSVTSLLRFRCVCKYFRDLIDSGNFILFHLKNSPNIPSRLIAQHYLINTDEVLEDLGWESVLDADVEDDDGAEGDEPQNPLALSSLNGVEDRIWRFAFIIFTQRFPILHQIHIIGSIGGLFLLHSSFGGAKDRLALWNPAKVEFRQLPRPIFPFRSLLPNAYVVGFGFNRRRNAFVAVKVPTFSLNYHDIHPPEFASVGLYTFGPDANDHAWKVIGNVQVFDSVRNLFWRCQKSSESCRRTFSGACFNGVIYWLVECECSLQVISFDLDREVFNEVIAPPRVDELRCNLWGHRRLVQKDEDSIALLSMEFTEEIEGVERRLVSIDGWVMREHGNWIRHFSLRRDNTSIGIRFPLGFWENEDELFIESANEKLVLYNHKTRTHRDFGVHGLAHTSHCFLGVFTYKESLVSVKRPSDIWNYDEMRGTVHDFLSYPDDEISSEDIEG